MTTTTPEGAGEFPPLKPCPFCGGAATMIDRPDGPLLVGAFAGCDRCDMHTPILPFAVEAAAAWNRRAQAAEGGKEKAVAWLVEPNALSHPKMKRELTFDHPHERPDWTVTPLVRNALATPEAAEGEQSAAQVAGQDAAADPMDWPLPCDVTVGHGTMRKGVSLRTLVLRMKTLYEMATGNDADVVANRTPEERKALADKFLAAIHDPRPLHEQIAEVRRRERPSAELLNTVVGATPAPAHPLPVAGEEVQAWLPIESAPKDGQAIILGYDFDEEYGGFVGQGRWHEEDHDGPDNMGHDAGFMDDQFDFFKCARSFGNPAYQHKGLQPTRWQPLPDPPAAIAHAAPAGETNDGEKSNG